MKNVSARLTVCLVAFGLFAVFPGTVFGDETCQGEQLDQEQLDFSTEPESAPEGPFSDFVVSKSMAASRIRTEWGFFFRSNCALSEGCVRAPGWRRLLRFYTRIINQGPQDFHFGSPTDPRNAGHVQYDTCHGHYHVKDWASYELLSATGSTVIRGRKQAFCLRDSVRIFGRSPRKYSCGYQGLSTGWADNYPASLGCQWIDITGVPPGSYLLQITVNPLRRFLESNYNNNVIRVPVRIR